MYWPVNGQVFTVYGFVLLVVIQHPAHCTLHQLSAIFQVQFVADLFAVRIDRMRANVQLLRDRRGG